MLLTCIYLYLNKSNMCAWTLLSDSVDCAQNINPKWLQSSPLIGIFKNIAITLKLASGILLHTHIYMTDHFPQIIMHLAWSCSVKHTHRETTKPPPTKQNCKVWNSSIHLSSRSPKILLNFNITL